MKQGTAGQPESELSQAKIGIQKANAAFLAAIKARNPAQLVAEFYAEDATVLPPNQEAISGKAQVEALWDGLLRSGLKDLTLTTDLVEQSGDLAYEVGQYTMAINSPQGETVSDRGKYVVVWQRQRDGSWKAKADIFNTSLPASTSQRK